jgi:hypothetical protein
MNLFKGYHTDEKLFEGYHTDEIIRSEGMKIQTVTLQKI